MKTIRATTFTFNDEPPALRRGLLGAGRPLAYIDAYEACQANPGKWTIWASNSSALCKGMAKNYPGCEFVKRNYSGTHGELWGRYVGTETPAA